MIKEKVEEFIKEKPGKISVVYKELKTGDGFEINGHLRLPSASTIKLVIMATVLDKVKKGEISLDQKLTLTEKMITGGDGVLKEMRLGHTFAIEEIMKFMIIVSDNMATNILIDLLGMNEINLMAKKLGLEHAILGRHMMDGEAKKQGKDNFICALDMAKMLEIIYNGTFVDKACSEIALGILKRQQQMGRLQLYLPEEVIVAHKCGDLDFLEHDGGIFLLEDKPYILVVLTSDDKTNKDGREIIGLVSKMVYDEVTSA